MKAIDNPEFAFTWTSSTSPEQFDWLRNALADDPELWRFVYQAVFQVTTAGQLTVTLHRFAAHPETGSRYHAQVRNSNGDVHAGAAVLRPVTVELDEFPPQHLR